MDARPIINQWLDDDDLMALAQVTANGYLACDRLIERTPIFSSFPVGMEFRSNLLRLFVEHALLGVPDLRSSFTYEVKPNAARNCSHVCLYKGGKFALTAHFVGQHDFRDSARPAIYRSELNARNLDLFASEANLPDLANDLDTGYCHLLHGGVVRPEVLVLAIPTRNQLGVSAVLKLQCPDPNVAEAEKIEDRVQTMLREQAHEQPNTDVTPNAS
ncbi:MAG TPA: hypothetical protein VGH91_07030 [Gammaproteobacteria bacterium]